MSDRNKDRREAAKKLDKIVKAMQRSAAKPKSKTKDIETCTPSSKL